MKQRFEWSPEKAGANWRKHGITFEQAAVAVADPFRTEEFDDGEDYGEERVNTLGMCRGTLLHVTYTERDERIRIISARRAEQYERDHYYRENSS